MEKQIKEITKKIVLREETVYFHYIYNHHPDSISYK